MNTQAKSVMRLRDLQPGDRFILVRTGKKYPLIRREHASPAGTRYIVAKYGEDREPTLNHACHVQAIPPTIEAEAAQ